MLGNEMVDFRLVILDLMKNVLVKKRRSRGQFVLPRNVEFSDQVSGSLPREMVGEATVSLIHGRFG